MIKVTKINELNNLIVFIILLADYRKLQFNSFQFSKNVCHSLLAPHVS